jgi:uncharacterized surface protein with fasciclin (FAS1) repeats
MRRLLFLTMLLLGFNLPTMAQQVTVSAQLRFAHLSPDSPAVEVWIDGAAADIPTINPGQITGWVEFIPGNVDIALVAEGGTLEEDTILGPVRLPLNGASWSTLALLGSNETDNLSAALIPSSFDTPLQDNQSRITVFNALVDAPAVDVILADGPTLIENLAFGQYASLDVVADSYDLLLLPAGETAPVLFEVPTTQIRAGSDYFLAIAGTGDAPELITGVVNQPQETLAATLEVPVEITAEPAPRDLFDTLEADGRFTVFLNAVQTAGLEATLRTQGPFTLFVPTDDAFDQLPQNTLSDLLADPQALGTLLLYHTLLGEFDAQGGTIDVFVENGTVILNGTAEIVESDITAFNGIIHAVDTVLLSPAQ